MFSSLVVLAVAVTLFCIDYASVLDILAVAVPPCISSLNALAVVVAPCLCFLLLLC